MEHMTFFDKSDVDNFGQIDFDKMVSDKTFYERHLMQMFLKRVCLSRWNKFPIDLIHDDKPDFQFKQFKSKKWIGVEVTRACDMAQKEVINWLKSGNQPYCYSTNSFVPFMAKKKSKELINTISAGDEIQIVPLMGDEPERRWAKYIQKAMYKKKSDFNKINFKKFTENILLVNVEIPGMVAVRDFEVGLNYLRAELSDFWNEKITFDVVFILHDDVVIELDSTSVVMH